MKQQIKETLYGEPKGGKAKQWAVYVTGPIVTVEWGRMNGKLQTKDTLCTPKNVGRSNETSPSEQAILEATSKWEKQWDKYYRPSVEEAEAIEEDGVMLSQDYTKKPHFLEESFYASPKLDGLRTKTVMSGGIPEWQSRGNKTYPVPPQIVSELQLLEVYSGESVFDGEAYVHGVKLQKIQSCVKKHNELTPQVTYQIFDVPVKGEVWEERLDRLNALSDAIEELGLKYICIVPQELTTKAQIKETLHAYLSLGYEGAMYRNPRGLYEFQNKRSNDLLKHKEFFDSEAKVVSCVEDKNGQGKFNMKWLSKSTNTVVYFELSMNGPHEDNTYAKLSNRIGEWVNFKYQDYTEDGVPTFARGIYFRLCDEDGSPIN